MRSRFFGISACVAAVSALGASALGARAAGSRFDSLCELPRVDRAHTTHQRCLACHDGTVAHAAEYLLSPPAVQYKTAHTIDRDYAAAAMNRAKQLVPKAALPKELVLVNGRVTCTTCHDGASREPSHTALPMSGSAMCFACHNM